MKSRQHRWGENLIRLSIPEFFKRFHLKKLISEPKASNTAPNNLLRKLGFSFEKEYLTVPGAINYEQLVNRWVMTREDSHKL